MGNMRDQMQALTQGIATSARERQLAVGDSKVQTARMLLAFGREREAMAEALKSGFVADRAARSGDVGTILANTGAMCREFRQDHARMRRSLRGTLAESTEAVAGCVASLRADFAKARAGFAKAHRHTAKAQRTGLAKDRHDRSRDVAELMKDFHALRGEMAEKLEKNLAKSTQEIRSHVSGLNEWGRASLQQNRERAQATRRIPSYLLAAQGGGEAPAWIPALSDEPEGHGKKAAKKKTSFGEAVRHFVGKSGKPKKK